MPVQPRPQIKPGLRQVWRDRSTVQIGLSPDAGVVVAGLEPTEADLLARLDGTRAPAELTAWAADRGVPPERVESLLALLDSAGVLTGRPTDRASLHRLGDRERQRLRPDALAWSVVYPDAGDGFGLLAERVRHHALLVGRGRLALAARSAVRRTGVQVDHEERLPHPLPTGTLVLLIGEDAVSTSAGAVLLNAGLAHLAVVAGTDRATIGPLVVPGRSACLRCLELHRTDRDPAWPAVSAQLGAAPPAARGESLLSQLAAGLLALQVACWVDQRRAPASLGATLTVGLPDGLSTRRAWTMHPRCGCSWLAASAPTSLRGHGPSGDR
jgi:hypothetical protein